MKCFKCGAKLPQDSEFCQYCGANIKEMLTAMRKATQEQANPMGKEATNGKSRMWAAAIAVLSVALAASIGVNVFLGITYQNEQKKSDQLEKEISEQADDMHFLHEVVAIRPQNGTGKDCYHVYGCPYLEDLSEVRNVQKQTKVPTAQQCEWCMK